MLKCVKTVNLLHHYDQYATLTNVTVREVM